MEVKIVGQGLEYSKLFGKVKKLEKKSLLFKVVTLAGVFFCFYHTEVEKLTWALMWVASFLPLLVHTIIKDHVKTKAQDVVYNQLRNINYHHGKYSFGSEELFQFEGALVQDQDLVLNFSPTNEVFITKEASKKEGKLLDAANVLDFFLDWIFFLTLPLSIFLFKPTTKITKENLSYEEIVNNLYFELFIFLTAILVLIIVGKVAAYYLNKKREKKAYESLVELGFKVLGDRLERGGESYKFKLSTSKGFYLTKLPAAQALIQPNSLG